MEILLSFSLVVMNQFPHTDFYNSCLTTLYTNHDEFIGILTPLISGIVGNFLMFRLMSQPEFNKTSSSIYMRCMAVTDSLYLIRTVQMTLFHLIPSILTPGPNLYGGRLTSGSPIHRFRNYGLGAGTHLLPFL